jgi:catechol 2,3-dioxygenase-like lactoylglutathione lyase family enzyme
MLSQSPLYAYVPVHDLRRAQAFYQDKLGLGPGEPSDGGITFRCGGSTAFFMYPSAGAGTNRASCAFWAVDDVRATVAWLKGRGVVFEEYDTPDMKTVDSIFIGGGAAAAWFKDTEGNILAVVSQAQGS